MNLPSIIVLSIVILLAVIAIIYLKKSGRHGGCGCSSGQCNGCSAHCQYHSLKSKCDCNKK